MLIWIQLMIVDSYLAIEVVPAWKGEQKGEPLRMFANDHRKVSCDPEIQHEIERNFFLGHASYNVSVKIGCSNRSEQVKLAIKRQGFSVKNGVSLRVIYDQKFLPSTADGITSTRTLDLASSLEVGNATQRASNEKSPSDYSLRSVLTIAFRFRWFGRL